MQETWVQLWSGKIPHASDQLKPGGPESSWACALEPRVATAEALSPCSTREATQWEAHTPQLQRCFSNLPQLEKRPTINSKDPAQPEIKKGNNLKIIFWASAERMQSSGWKIQRRDYRDKPQGVIPSFNKHAEYLACKLVAQRNQDHWLSSASAPRHTCQDKEKAGSDLGGSVERGPDQIWRTQENGLNWFREGGQKMREKRTKHSRLWRASAKALRQEGLIPGSGGIRVPSRQRGQWSLQFIHFNFISSELCKYFEAHY